jgi:hypothetical protein
MKITYTIMGQGGNSEVVYTRPFSTFGEAMAAYHAGDFPLCPIGQQKTVQSGNVVSFQVSKPLPECIVESPGGPFQDYLPGYKRYRFCDGTVNQPRKFVPRCLWPKEWNDHILKNDLEKYLTLYPQEADNAADA